MKEEKEFPYDEILKALEYFKKETDKLSKPKELFSDLYFNCRMKLSTSKGIKDKLTKLVETRDKRSKINIRVNKSFLFNDEETKEIKTLRDLKEYIGQLGKEIKSLTETFIMLAHKRATITDVYNLYDKKRNELKVKYESHYFTVVEYNKLKKLVNNNTAFVWNEFETELKAAVEIAKLFKFKFQQVVYVVVAIRKRPEYKNESMDFIFGKASKLLSIPKDKVRYLWDKYAKENKFPKE